MQYIQVVDKVILVLLYRSYININEIKLDLSLLDTLFRQVHLGFEHALPSIGLDRYARLMLDLEEPKWFLLHRFRHC